MDWLRRLLEALSGGTRLSYVNDDRDPAPVTAASQADLTHDATPMNASGSPDDRDEADADDGGDGGGDGGGDDGGSDD